jgi:4-hydroxy-3-polyprenylbenzoate decarboxylase
MPPAVVVGITGASGAVLAKRCVEALAARGREVVVVCTPAGALVWQHELGEPFKRWVASAPCRHYAATDIAAPIASGTFPTAGMVVVPCSMDTLAAMAHGLSGNLLERAADVTLKEARPLVVVPRELPLSVIHLRNLLTLAELGVQVLPPMPHFYARPERVDEVVEHVVGRILVALKVDAALPEALQYGAGVPTP